MGTSSSTTAATLHEAAVRHLVFDVLDPTEQRSLRGALEKVASQLSGDLEQPAR